MQEILKILPDSCEHLALCSKAWSDATYLDEIHTSKFKEPLSIQNKRDVNLKAKEYAEKVENWHHFYVPEFLDALRMHEHEALMRAN